MEIFFSITETRIIAFLKQIFSMNEKLIPVHEQISHAMNGRTQTWLLEKLALKNIILTKSQLSKRLSGINQFTGDETVACFEILEIKIKETVN